MWLRFPLEDILSSRAKIALLRVLAASQTPLHGREIARRSGVGAGHVSRVLRELVAAGVVSDADQGRATTYELTRPLPPLVQQLVALFEAESTRYQAVVRRLTPRGTELLSLVLFGSEARGEARAGSDTDLLFIVREKSDEIEEEIGERCLALADDEGLALSWHLADLDDVRDWERTRHDLWLNITAEGLTLKGKSPERIRRACQRGATG